MCIESISQGYWNSSSHYAKRKARGWNVECKFFSTVVSYLQIGYGCMSHKFLNEKLECQYFESFI